MIEPAVRTERAQERLLERVVCSLGPESSAQQSQDVRAVLFVEALERGDRHGFHHPRLTPARADL